MTQSNRIWAIGSVTVMLVLVIAGWFLGAEPFLAAAAAADSERTSVEAQNQLHEAQIAQLATQNKDLSKLKKQVALLKASIPPSSNTSSFITGLNALGLSTGVQITGITVGDPQAYTVPVSASRPAGAPSDATSPTPAPAPVPKAPAAPPAVTNPLITPDNFVGILVSVDVAGSNDAVLAFTKGLQSGARLFLVTGYASDRVIDNPEPTFVTAHVSGYIYVLKQAG